MGQRIFIAGVIRNTPDAMVYWLQNPQKVMPGGAMPNLGLDERSARDITAYLYEAR
jgi:cytochrome c2